MKREVTNLKLIKENQALNNRLEMLIKAKSCLWNSVPRCVIEAKISPCLKKLACAFAKKGRSSVCLIKVHMQKDLCVQTNLHLPEVRRRFYQGMSCSCAGPVASLPQGWHWLSAGSASGHCRADGQTDVAPFGVTPALPYAWQMGGVR